jgi:seryl-tRNA synthetase
MLDINFIRNNRESVEKDLRRRKTPDKIEWVEGVLADDALWRAKKRETDDLRARRNILTRKVQETKKKGGDADAIIAEAKKLPDMIKALEDDMQSLEEAIRYRLMRLPNILDESVPEGESDADNVVVFESGIKRAFDFELKHHGQAAVDLGVADFERAVKISGAGYYFLKGDLAMLDLALQNHAVRLLTERGYTLIQPPLMMRRKPYEGVTDLDDFGNVMYKIDSDDQYLIATSEHPMAAMHMDEVIGDLPIKYAGISACFRREIGRHGLDERGLFRVHQFNKIEQFIFCNPRDSRDYFEELIGNAKSLMDDLRMPYRVVNVCTGDMGTVAAKKYDLEGWSPREEKYIELMSCSNCTDYQANRLNIRYKSREGNRQVHTLNSTMVATSRALRLILENYQEKDGSITIPEVLRQYMAGKEAIVGEGKKP